MKSEQIKTFKDEVDKMGEGTHSAVIVNMSHDGQLKFAYAGTVHDLVILHWYLGRTINAIGDANSKITAAPIFPGKNHETIPTKAL
jgi:hypothetical protein